MITTAIVCVLLTAQPAPSKFPETPDGPRGPRGVTAAQSAAAAATSAPASAKPSQPVPSPKPLPKPPPSETQIEESKPLPTIKAAAYKPSDPPEPDLSNPAEFDVQIVSFQRVGGAMVRLTTDETGGVSVREWWVEPPIEDFDPVPGTDGKLVYLATPHAGEYKVYCAVAGMVNGKIRMAHATKTIVFNKGDSTVPARIAPDGARVKPHASPAQVITEAAMATESPTWRADIIAIADIYRRADSIEAGNEAAAAKVPPIWKSFFAKMQALTKGLRDEGLIVAGDDRERQHLDKTADTLEGLK